MATLSFLGRALKKDQALPNSNDTTVTSFLNQSQHNFSILLEILSCTFVANLSKIGMFIFPWQHILETTLMRNEAIQLSNDVTVTLLLNQSLQNFGVFFKMTSSTSVQILAKQMLNIAMATHSLKSTWQIESLKPVMTSL